MGTRSKSASSLTGDSAENESNGWIRGTADEISVPKPEVARSALDLWNQRWKANAPANAPAMNGAFKGVPEKACAATPASADAPEAESGVRIDNMMKQLDSLKHSLETHGLAADPGAGDCSTAASEQWPGRELRPPGQTDCMDVD